MDLVSQKRVEIALAIRKFEKSKKPGVWPHLRKDDLLADIRLKTRNSFQVNQGRTPLCGPAAIIFELARKKPKLFVRICQTLYESGKLQHGKRKVFSKPSKSLLKSKVRKGISIADWMLMAAMRDIENAIFDVDANSGDIATGITTPSEMKGWTKELLGYKKVKYESLYFYGEFDAMKKAKQIVKKGGVAFLLVDKAMVTGKAPAVASPDHWISFLGKLNIDDGNPWIWDSGHIKFQCYSWGKKYDVSLGEGPFEDYIWGMVTGI